MTRAGSRGTTLLELMVGLAIVAVLIGIAFVAMGPARERAARADCMSRLHQLGVAISLYRQDYGGREYGTIEQMGLPPRLDVLRSLRTGGGSGYVTDDSILRCARGGGQPVPLGSAWVTPWFSYNVHPPEVSRLYPQVPELRRIVKERGPDYPLVFDEWHDEVRPDRAPGSRQRFVMVLRLDGRVTSGPNSYRIGTWEY